MTYPLTLATPDKVYFDGPVDGAVFPGLTGSFGVLPDHAPLIAGLSRGILTIHCEHETRFFVVDGGMAQVGGNRADVLADAVVAAEDAADAEERLEELTASHHRPMESV
jgi:F-type H+-transporting ATPase subunit epsilon